MNYLLNLGFQLRFLRVCCNVMFTQALSHVVYVQLTDMMNESVVLAVRVTFDTSKHKVVSCP